MKKNTIMWLALAALGLFIIIGHNLALEIVCKVIAVGLLVAAAGGIISFFKAEEKSGPEIAKLVSSAAFICAGMWILLDTPAFITFMNVVLGLIMIIAGALGLIQAFKNGKDTVSIVIAAIGIVLGLIIACNNAATTWFTVCEGLGLIYSAVTGYISEHRRSQA